MYAAGRMYNIARIVRLIWRVGTPTQVARVAVVLGLSVGAGVRLMRGVHSKAHGPTAGSNTRPSHPRKPAGWMPRRRLPACAAFAASFPAGAASARLQRRAGVTPSTAKGHAPLASSATAAHPRTVPVGVVGVGSVVGLEAVLAIRLRHSDGRGHHHGHRRAASSSTSRDDGHTAATLMDGARHNKLGAAKLLATEKAHSPTFEATAVTTDPFTQVRALLGTCA